MASKTLLGRQSFKSQQMLKLQGCIVPGLEEKDAVLYKSRSAGAFIVASRGLIVAGADLL